MDIPPARGVPASNPVTPPPAVTPPVVPPAFNKTMGANFEPPRRRFRRLWLWLPLGLIVLLLIVAAVAGYWIVLRSQTRWGSQLQDKVWQQMVDREGIEPVEGTSSFTYTDSGNFNFVPSEVYKVFDPGVSQTEIEEMDKYAFTLNGLKLAFASTLYSNFTDIKNPQVDMATNSSVTNAGKTYAGDVAVKIDEKTGFVKFNINDEIKQTNAVKDMIGESELNKYLDKWIKFMDPEDTEDLEELSRSLSLQGGLESARQRSRDAKRVADVRQIASALELYYNDHNGYPAAQNGQPALIQPYLPYYPTAPTPVDGKCLDSYNTYTYTPQGPTHKSTTYSDADQSVDVYSDYRLTFCIGGETGGFEAGNLVLTPGGILPNADCAEGNECYKDPAAQGQERNPYRELLRNNRPFSIQSFKGFTMMNGHLVAHYGLQVDKPAIKRIIEGSLRETLGEGTSAEEAEIKEFMNEVTDIMLDKLEVKTYEVWVGLKDRRVYKTLAVSNAISVTKTADMIYQKVLSEEYNDLFGEDFGTGEKASNAKRVADIHQLASALELYYNDTGGYPEAKDGVPVGLSPVYMGVIPTSPQPPESPCDDYYNTYWYTPTGAPQQKPDASGNVVNVYQSYTYSFCLSQDTGGLKAGNRVLTERGFDSYAPEAPYEDKDSYNQPSADEYEQKIKETMLNALRELPWDAEVRVESTIKNYNVSRKVDLPKDFIDMDKEGTVVP